MSLIPFILDLADELHEFSRCLASGVDINDFGFGLYTGANDQHQQQQQATSPQQQQHPHQSSSQQQSPRRRTSSFSSSFWMPTKRHHPYNRIKSACCGKSLGDEGGIVNIGIGITGSGGDKDVASPAVTPGKAASYSVVNKNGFQVSMNVKQFAPNELSVKTIDNCIVVEGRHDDKEDGHGVISRHFVRKYMLPKGYDPKDVQSTLSSDGILTVKAPPPPPPIAKNDERIERVVEIQPAPGPAQTVSAAKEAAPLKEQTKKLLSPAARAECQLPEKRQKLDLPQEQEATATAAKTPPPSPTEAAQQPPPSTPTTSSSLSSSEACATAVAPLAAAAAAAVADEESGKAEEPSAESENKQTQEKASNDVVAAVPAATAAAAAAAVAADDVLDGDDGKKTEEKKEVAQQNDDKQLKQKDAMEIDETEKPTIEDKLPETNGDTDTAAPESSSEAKEPVSESSTTSATKIRADDEVPAENANKKEGNATTLADNASKMEVDEVEQVVANNSETPNKAEKTEKAEAKEKNTNSISNNSATQNNEKAKSENVDNTTADSVPADSVKPAATTKATEAVADGDAAAETAVSKTEAKIDIDDVALLKAAVTADAAEITAAEENALLSEPMDGIATTGSPPSVVDTVECSLFAKTHLGNGNSATLVATEEVAN